MSRMRDSTVPLDERAIGLRERRRLGKGRHRHVRQLGQHLASETFPLFRGEPLPSRCRHCLGVSSTCYGCPLTPGATAMRWVYAARTQTREFLDAAQCRCSPCLPYTFTDSALRVATMTERSTAFFAPRRRRRGCRRGRPAENAPVQRTQEAGSARDVECACAARPAKELGRHASDDRPNMSAPAGRGIGKNPGKLRREAAAPLACLHEVRG